MRRKSKVWEDDSRTDGNPCCRKLFCIACHQEDKDREWKLREWERVQEVRLLLKRDPNLAVTFQRVLATDGMPKNLSWSEKDLHCFRENERSKPITADEPAVILKIGS